MSRRYIGHFRCDAPLTPEQVAEDRLHLDALLSGVPDSVTIREAEVWINGREWRWSRIDVTTRADEALPADPGKEWIR